MRIDVRPWHEFDDREVAAYAGLRSEIDFGVPPYAWTAADDRPVRLLGWEGSHLVAHAGIVEREVLVGGQEGGKTLRVAGLYSVMVRPDRQGTGLGTAIVTAALAEASRCFPQSRHAVFVCLESRVPFYQRLGACRIDPPVTFDQHDGPHVMGIVTMRRPVAGESWPDGAVHLVGLPW